MNFSNFFVQMIYPSINIHDLVASCQIFCLHFRGVENCRTQGKLDFAQKNFETFRNLNEYLENQFFN